MADRIEITVERVTDSQQWDYRITGRHPKLHTDTETFISGGEVLIDQTVEKITRVIEDLVGPCERVIRRATNV